MVTVQMDPVGPVADLLALLEFVNDVRITRGGDESREPVQSRYNRVFDLARGYPARPTDDRRCAEAALKARSLASGERGLATIGPSEVLGTVIGREGEDRVSRDCCPSDTS
jgi:hypothetical protein